METRWTPAFPLERIPTGGARLFKHDGSQVAVFRLPDGVYAVDNRCPHEGYPLIQGTVSGCALTCQWHNFKFDLRNGACLMGEDPVRAYPTRVVDGVVEVDLAPPASLVAGWWADLEVALHRHEMGRAARNVVRLLDVAADPGRVAGDIALFGAVFDAARGEYGPSHALAVAEEVALHPIPGVEPALPLVQALDVAARSTVRLPVRSVPTPVDPGDDAVAAGVRLRTLVEGEKGEEAEALVRGAIARGWRRAELEPWFFQLSADHFLDFGHFLIYSTKVFDLLDAGEWRGADTLLGALTWGVVCGTREDLLPPWSGWRRRMERLPELGEGTLDRDALVDLEPAAAWERVASIANAIDALSIAAAERMLRFDVAIDRDPTVAEGWLDVTHTQTFTHAVRLASGRWQHPDARRLVLMATQFVTMMRVLDGPRRASAPIASSADEVVEAVAARATDLAVDRAAGYLAEGDATELVHALERQVLRDHATRAIFLAHLLKNLRAGAAERIATGDDRPLLAAIRFLASPLRERNLERGVNDAINLVRNGRPPRTLVG